MPPYIQTNMLSSPSKTNDIRKMVDNIAKYGIVVVGYVTSPNLGISNMNITNMTAFWEIAPYSLVEVDRRF
jgi:hypothetical protein